MADGKRILVTRNARGIGLAVAAAAGARLRFTERTAAKRLSAMVALSPSSRIAEC